MSLNLINGLFYAEFELQNIDNQAVIDEVTDIYLNKNIRMTDELDDSRPHRDEVDIQHTFYEDCPVTEILKTKFAAEIKKITDNNFGGDSYYLEEIWGHFTPPLGSTMVHDHAGGCDENNGTQLSWVYYPHQPKDAGNINFIANANEARLSYEVPIKPGHLYLFSSSLLHFVPRNASGQDRISVSGNLISTPQFTEVVRDDDDWENNIWYFIGRNEKLLR